MSFREITEHIDPSIHHRTYLFLFRFRLRLSTLGRSSTSVEPGGILSRVGLVEKGKSERDSFRRQFKISRRHGTYLFLSFRCSLSTASTSSSCVGLSGIHPGVGLDGRGVLEWGSSMEVRTNTHYGHTGVDGCRVSFVWGLQR